LQTPINTVEFGYNDSPIPIAAFSRWSPQNILFVYNDSCKFILVCSVSITIWGHHTSLLWPNRSAVKLATNRWAVTNISLQWHQWLSHQQQSRQIVVSFAVLYMYS